MSTLSSREIKMKYCTLDLKRPLAPNKKAVLRETIPGHKVKRVQIKQKETDDLVWRKCEGKHSPGGFNFTDLLFYDELFVSSINDFCTCICI